MSFIAWSRWHERLADDDNLKPLAHMIACNITGWADSSGGGWAIDDDQVADWVKRYGVTEQEVRDAIGVLCKDGYISLSPFREEGGLRTGQVLFGYSRMVA